MDVVRHDHKGMQAIVPQFAGASFNYQSGTFRHGLILQPNGVASSTIEHGIYFSETLAERFAGTRLVSLRRERRWERTVKSPREKDGCTRWMPVR